MDLKNYTITMSDKELTVARTNEIFIYDLCTNRVLLKSINIDSLIKFIAVVQILVTRDVEVTHIKSDFTLLKPKMLEITVNAGILKINCNGALAFYDETVKATRDYNPMLVAKKLGIILGYLNEYDDDNSELIVTLSNHMYLLKSEEACLVFDYNCLHNSVISDALFNGKCISNLGLLVDINNNTIYVDNNGDLLMKLNSVHAYKLLKEEDNVPAIFNEQLSPA